MVTWVAAVAKAGGRKVLNGTGQAQYEPSVTEELFSDAAAAYGQDNRERAIGRDNLEADATIS